MPGRHIGRGSPSIGWAYLNLLIAGTLAGIAGMMHVTLTRMAVPPVALGDQLDVLAPSCWAAPDLWWPRSGHWHGPGRDPHCHDQVVRSSFLSAWLLAACSRRGLLIFSVSAQALSEASRRRSAGRKALVSA